MRVCDICKTNEATCQPKVPVNTKGGWKTIDACDDCCLKWSTKAKEYSYLAYEEVVKEVTSEAPHKKKPWWNIFKR
jgi:hypothetical protein